MYGDVHLAIHKKTKEKLAIKIVKTSVFKKMPLYEKLTENEISVLKNMDNENIIKFKELIRTSEKYYFVYEYCNGGNLHTLVKEKKKSLDEKQGIIYFK